MKPIFLDSSFFKAILDSKDDFHNQAQRIFDGFTKDQAALITTNYIVDESLTLMRNRCGLKHALKLRDFLKETRVLVIIRVTIKDDAKAWEWFEKDWSNLSFTDCVSFAVMQRLDITHVATFDEHFSRAGFTIAS